MTPSASEVRTTTAAPTGSAEEAVPPGTATLPRLFAAWVARYGGEPALAERRNGGFESFTYAELDRRASALAAAFVQELGLRRGELVALICDNRPEWMVCSLAIHFVGAVDVPRASETPPAILEAILRHAEPAVVILEHPAQLPLVRAAAPGLRSVVVIDGEAGGGVLRYADLLACGGAAAPEVRAEVERRRVEVEPDDLATVIYTSGTTGAPKGVALTHANYELNLRELPKLLELERVPVVTVLQPWHAYERQMQLMYLSKGCCLHYSSVLRLRGDLPLVRPVVMATVPELWVKLYKGVFLKIDGRPPGRRRLARWLVARALTSARARRVLEGREPEVRPRGPLRRATARAWARVVAVALSPFHALADRLVFRELRAGLGGRLRFPCVGGGPLPGAVDEFFDAAGLTLLEGYGMTEAIVVMAMRDPFHRVLRSTGHVIRGMEHRLLGDDGRPCPPGGVGRLQVRGPNVMRGYYKDPARTAEVLSGDGWLDTRDLALAHADGSLRVLGRLDDTLVLTNGENVNAPYLENELCANEWIDRAVVVGEGRPYVAAFVKPSLTHLEGLARRLGLPVDDLAALVADERVVKHYRRLASAISADLRRFAPYERIHRVRLWLEDFRIGHELSQTLKLRRHEFSRLYSSEIDDLYAS
ncbi:MAG TPA: AMP-binding protein [Thermoleophilia bacterium]|nr:AMP-binding protein [Thermoleophilia bacterium]